VPLGLELLDHQTAVSLDHPGREQPPAHPRDGRSLFDQRREAGFVKIV
jgi:hypothetical protein